MKCREESHGQPYYPSKASRRMGKSVAAMMLIRMNTSRLAATVKLVTFLGSVRRAAGYNGRTG